MAKYPESQREALRQYLNRYLLNRNQAFFFGEFIDEAGSNGSQFGLTGTCLGLHLARTQHLNAPVVAQSETTLPTALHKAPASRTAAETQLAKDYGRISAKTIIAMLILDNAGANAVLRSILAGGLSNDLVKPVLDDPNIPGDALLTAYFFHIIHISKVTVEPDLVEMLVPIAKKLETSLLASSDSLSRELFISSALCLFDHAQHIRHHEWLLARLYRDGYDFRGALADSPFIESFYEDKQRSGPARSRYVRVPKAYAILVSIYIALGNEKDYFKFRGVKKLIGSITVPYSHFVSGDRQRSAVYFVFFLFLSLFPAQYFSPLRPHFGTFFRHRRRYYFGNMNWASWLGFLIAVGCLVFSLFLTGRGLTSDPIDWTDVRYAVVMFVFGFVGWLIRSFGGKRE